MCGGGGDTLIAPPSLAEAMGAESCKSCDKSQNREETFNDKAGNMKYDTSGVQSQAPSSRSAGIPLAAANKKELGFKGVEITSPVGSGDAAGGAGQDKGRTMSAATGSYSSTYFGREAAELPLLPMPPGNSPITYIKTHVFHTGAEYNGEWKGNQRDGYGIQRWLDGAEYRGQWKANAATGMGMFKHSDESVYVGEWRDNIAHGFGIYRHKDGTTYEGSFAEDLQDGQGVESWADNSMFVGQFLKGKKNGYGEYTWPDSSKYSGQWKLNQIDGIGAYVGADARKFDGAWSVSMMHGLGKYQWPDGRAYEGQYIEDQKDGFGIFTWADGRYYEGYWQEGRQHGYGRLYQDGGCSRLAKWNAGERVEWCEDGNSPTRLA